MEKTIFVGKFIVGQGGYRCDNSWEPTNLYLNQKMMATLDEIKVFNDKQVKITIEVIENN